ncbi:hypothetical protein GFS31_05370 [Leptolyngbya sp. BL0902]|uniref:hypothetical protein n=1 Tax=Leptolyngbya sp. BL0902 TaxID=1115757 RepID=UPI0018E78173|nr:hypothetical protein [Leptolyngbya sp. BL0902]QQE63866.1 hypothetical protein GFS31_05370 [Leptolyngbya sp. BL0902]
MKTMRQTLTLSVVALALSFLGGTALAQSVARTPLTQTVQAQGSVTPSQPSACGLRAPGAAQVLDVREDFTAVNIAVSGSPGLTLFIEGPEGFSECHTTSGPSGTVNAPGLLNRGRYTFYVGNANPVTTTYQLAISQD